MKGFVREVARAGVDRAGHSSRSMVLPRASVLFKDVVKTENLALFFGFSVVFLGTLLAGFLAIWLITKFVKFAKIQWFDRLLGAAFGFIRGWVLASIIFLGLTSFDVQTERVRNSNWRPIAAGRQGDCIADAYEMKARFLVGIPRGRTVVARAALIFSARAAEAAEEEDVREREVGIAVAEMIEKRIISKRRRRIRKKVHSDASNQDRGQPDQSCRGARRPSEHAQPQDHAAQTQRSPVVVNLTLGPEP